MRAAEDRAVKERKAKERKKPKLDVIKWKSNEEMDLMVLKVVKKLNKRHLKKAISEMVIVLFVESGAR